MLPTAPGQYRFSDSSGAPPQQVDVVLDAGELCARFVDDGDVELIPIRDMAGTWAQVS